MDFRIAKTRKIDIQQDGLNVVVKPETGQAIELPWDAAIELAKAILRQSRRIEEMVKADAIAGDQALLMRLGVPFGLTSNPILIDEAKKLAAWDSNLRRYIPSGKAKGIQSQAIFGKPTIVKHKRRKP